MRILITNYTLATRSGTETYLRDLAIGLLARGHSPIVYSPRIGDIANELRALTIPVVDDLCNISGRVDIIHGHHRHETITALLHFPGTPAVFFVHDWHAWQDLPLEFPRILRYVAVDGTRFDRLVLENGIAEKMVTILPNGVDTQRFLPRALLPQQPQRGLVFSNYVKAEAELADLRRACELADISLDIVGEGWGQIAAEPERILPGYDLVFALGRSALEAMSVGCGAVIWGLEGLGGFVHTGNFAQLQRSNFGRRALRPASVDELLAEIRRYDREEVQAVQNHVRTSLNQSDLVDRHLTLYRDVIDETTSRRWDPEAELRLAAHYIKSCEPQLQQNPKKAKQENRFNRRRRRLLDALWICHTLLVIGFCARVEMLAFSDRAYGLIVTAIPICILLCWGLYLLRMQLRGDRIL